MERQTGNRIRLAVAAAVLVAGAACAATIATASPGPAGADPQMLRRLAVAVKQSNALTPPSPFSRAAAAPPPVSAPAFGRSQEPRRGGAAKAGRASHIHPSVTPTAAPDPAPPADPVQSVALLGVTYRNHANHAWLVDLNTQERQVTEEGGTAFGFTVRRIGPDNVVLARDDKQFSLRLGEKPIPSLVAEAEDPEPAETAAAEQRSGGRRFWGGRGGGGRGGGRVSGRRSRGGGNNSGSARSFGGGRRARRQLGNLGRRFAGGGAPGNLFRGGSTTRRQAPTVTANPQTARRLGIRLVSEAQAFPQPEPLINPQTQRRVGTNSGPAFGSGQGGSGQRSSQRTNATGANRSTRRSG